MLQHWCDSAGGPRLVATSLFNHMTVDVEGDGAVVQQTPLLAAVGCYVADSGGVVGWFCGPIRLWCSMSGSSRCCVFPFTDRWRVGNLAPMRDVASVIASPR